MESFPGEAKRKRSEESSRGTKLVKKARIEVVIPKLSVPNNLLERLRKFSAKQKDTTKDKVKQNGLTLTNGESSRDVEEPTSPLEQGTISNALSESPVRHRLSNLLNGSLPSLEDDERKEASDCKAASDCEFKESNCGEQFLDLPSEKADLFDTDWKSGIGIGILPSDRGERDRTSGSAIESSSVNDCHNIHSSASSGMEAKPSSNQLISETEILNNDAILIDEHINGNDHCEVSENGISSANCSPESGREAAVASDADSGHRPISSSPQGNSLDYATDYNTLEFMNTLLSDLTQERAIRSELDERVTLIKVENEELKKDCEKLKALINDLLHHPQAKPDTVSRGTQINMTLSLRRGRTVNRATSPIRKRDPSPDITLLSSSVGCQTIPFEPPKCFVSSFCQTDEEVIPPKILMSVSSQTDPLTPSAPPHPTTIPSIRGQSVVSANNGPTATSELPNPLRHSQASNIFQAAYYQSVLSYQLALGLPPQQAHSLLAAHNALLPGPVTSGNPTGFIQHYPASVARVPSTAYQSGISAPTRTTQSSNVSQHASVHAVSLNRMSNTIANPTSDNQSSPPVTMRPNGAVGPMAQRTTIRQSWPMNHTLPQVSRVCSLVGRPQPMVASPTSVQVIPHSPATWSRNVVTQQAGQQRLSENQSSTNLSSVRMRYQQPLHFPNAQPQMQGVARSPSHENPLSWPLTSQRAQFNSLSTRSDLGANSAQPATNLNVSTNPSGLSRNHFHCNPANNIPQVSHYQGENSVFPLNQALAQSRPLNAQLNNQQTLASAGTTIPQPVTPSAGRTQVNLQRNPTSLLQNQNDRDLNSIPCQSNVNQMTVQDSAPSPSILSSLQTQPSNGYHNTIPESRKMGAERNRHVPREQPTAQLSGTSLYSQVKQVYSELRQSLEEVAGNKEEASSTITTVENGSNDCENYNLPSSSNSTGLLQQKRTKDKENMTSLNGKSHRKSLNGALESTVQRLLALQKKQNSSTNSSSQTTDSVNALFEGASGQEKYVESTGLEPSATNVSYQERISENESVSDPVSETSASEMLEREGTRDCLVTDINSRETEARVGSSAENNRDDVFVSPSAPLTSKVESDKHNTDTDDPYGYLMSPIIPQTYSARRSRTQISRLDWNSGENDSHITGKDHEDQESGNEPRQAEDGDGDMVETRRNLCHGSAIADAQQRALREGSNEENEDNDYCVMEQERFVPDPDNRNEPQPGVCSRKALGDGHKEEGTETAEPYRAIADRNQIETNESNGEGAGKEGPEFVECEKETHEPIEAEDNVDLEMESESERNSEKASESEINTDNVNAQSAPEVVDVVDKVTDDSNVDTEESVETDGDCGIECVASGDKKHGAQTQSALPAQNTDTGHSELDLNVSGTEKSLQANNNTSDHRGTDGETTSTGSITNTLDEGDSTLCGEWSSRDQDKLSDRPSVQGEGHLDNSVKPGIDCHNHGLQSQANPRQAESSSADELFRAGVIEGIETKLLSDILTCPDKNINQNMKENAPNNPERQCVDGLTMHGVPRVVARLINSDLLIMWDLPPYNQLADIDHFELFVRILGGEWLRIAQVKALRLPMGCRLKYLKPGRTFSFRVRAVGHDGVTGVMSQPSDVISL